MLAEIEKALMGELRGPDTLATGVSVDSRTIRQGDLFFALRGARDGVEFVPDAFARGAAGAVVPVYFKGRERPIIVVEETLPALGRLAFFHRNRLRSRVIAITGSFGKTATKDMLSLILSARFSVSASPKSFNNNIGVPLSILASDDHDFLVLEIGTNHHGEIRALGGLARPHMAAITAIGRSHLQAFGSTEGVAREKSSLLSCIERNGLAFLPQVLPHEDIVLSALRPDIRLIRFSAENPRLEQDAVSFVFRGQEFRVPVPHPGYAHDAACALAIAFEFGVSPEEAQSVLSSYSPTGMRMRIEEMRGIKVINDAYNSNPDSAEALVLSLSAPERTVLVLGEMLELGEASPAMHKELGEIAGARGFKAILCVGQEAKETARASRGEWFPNPEGAAARLVEILKPGDTLVLKGSRLVGLERILEVLGNAL